MRNKCFLMIACLMACIVLGGCKGKKGPALSAGSMEDVLYDYAMADGICAQLHPGDSVYLKAYREAIFKKHGITEAEFDSCLKWYSRNPDKMFDIYTAVAERIDKKQETVTGEHHDGFDDAEVYATSGDTANIWKNSPYIVLTNVPGKNVYRFSIPVDTAFHTYDKFEWRMNTTYLDKRGDHKPLVLGLKAKFTNDSIQGTTRCIYSNSSAVLTMNCDSAYKIREMDGFIVLPGKTKENVSDVLLTRVVLLRYHRKASDMHQNQTTNMQPGDIPSVGGAQTPPSQVIDGGPVQSQNQTLHGPSHMNHPVPIKELPKMK